MFTRARVALAVLTVSAAVVMISVVFVRPSAGAYDVDVVDVIVRDWSDETTANPEPTLAVDQARPDLIAVSAFGIGAGADRPPFCPIAADASLPQSDSGGVVISTDGGLTWSLRCVLPTLPDHWTQGGVLMTGYTPPVDATLGFAPKTHELIGAYVSPPASLTGRVAISRQSGWIDPDVVNVRWWDLRPQGMGTADQPQLAVAPYGTDAQFVIGTVTHDDDVCANGGVIWHIDKFTLRPRVSCVNDRASDGWHSYVRAAIHASGQMYAAVIRAYQRGSTYDLVLLKGRVGPDGVASFAELSDGGSGSDCGMAPIGQGNRLRCKVRYNTDNCPPGKSRVGSEEFALDVDPRNAAHVFIAYGERTGTSFNTIHLAETTDGGMTLSPSFFDVDDAINPAVAVDRNGRAALLFQQVVTNPDDGSQWWSTRIRIFDATHSKWTDIVLSVHPVDEPAFTCSDYDTFLGDYIALRAVESSFYGVFSADNNPYWHPTARYLRDLDVSGGVRKLPAAVSPSIDPFFFKISPREVPFIVTPWNQTKMPAFLPDDPRIPLAIRKIPGTGPSPRQP